MANEINFTPITFGAAADEDVFNDPLRELDTAIKKNTWDATSAPTVSDDSTGGYSIGSRWMDISTGTYYVCAGATPGAAVWLQMAGGITGVIDLDGTAGEALAERDYVYLASDNKWYRVDIDAATLAVGGLRGIVVESGGIGSGLSGDVRVAGEVAGYSAASFDAGDPVYAAASPGALTATKPTVTAGGVQKAVVQAGVATSDTRLLLLREPVEYLKRASLANNGSLTVEHHADPQAQSRDVAAFITSQDEGTKLTDYADTNQDSDVDLMTGIRDSLIEWWALDETSGNRTGAHAAKVLTDYNTVGYATGKQGNAAHFIAANSEYLARPSESDLQTGDIDFTWAFWVKVTTLPPAGRAVLGKYSTAAGEYLFWVTAAGALSFIVYDGAGTTVGTVNASASLSAGTWYHVVAWHDAAANKVKIALNNGTPAEASTTGTPGTSSDAFQIAAYQGGSTYLDVDVDEVGFWKRLLTSTERTWLYNSGNARAYADTKHNTRLAQSFQIASAKDIGSVKLWLKKVGSPTGSLTVTIEPDSSGAPSGTPVTNGTSNTAAAGSLGTSYGWITFTFPTAPSLSASTTYWIVLNTTGTVDVDDYVVWGADASSPGYTGGEMKSYDGTSWSAESKDACFEVYEEGAVYEEPCVVGRWSNGTRDVGVRFDDGAGADGDTNTTFKNVSGATLDLTCVVELA